LDEDDAVDESVDDELEEGSDPPELALLSLPELLEDFLSDFSELLGEEVELFDPFLPSVA
jgi:hypothetical protein